MKIPHITNRDVARVILLLLGVLICLGAYYSLGGNPTFHQKQSQSDPTKEEMVRTFLAPGTAQVSIVNSSNLGPIPYLVEVADTDATRQLGLGGRTTIGKMLPPPVPSGVESQGMLFVFDNPGEYGFWMKDTLIPLDMIWISKDGTIVHIEKNVQPSSYPTVYTNESSKENGSDGALYVLELNAGEAGKNNFQVGQKTEIIFPESH